MAILGIFIKGIFTALCIDIINEAYFQIIQHSHEDHHCIGENSLTARMAYNTSSKLYESCRPTTDSTTSAAKIVLGIGYTLPNKS